MKKTTLSRFPLALLALAAFTAVGFAAPLSDSDVETAVTAFKDAAAKAPRTDRDSYMKAINAAAEAAVGKLDISEATIDQIEKLRGPLGMVDSQKTNLASRLGVLAATPTADGARAAVIQTQMNESPTADDVLNTFNHAGLTEALKAGKATTVFSLLSTGNLNYNSYDKAKLAAALDRTLGTEIPAANATATAAVFEFLSEDKNPADAATIEKYRAIIDGKLAAAIAANKDEMAAKRLTSMHSYLAGAYAKGQLLNHAAPNVTFKWTNSPTEVKSLADLKGKVVVLDFWATWCGPCIGSFPKVRELVAEYKDYPVVVLGVTSIQGSVSFPKATEADKKRIDCKDDPAKELSLLPEFIKSMDMTWMVAVSDQDVFNPDFGVRGIPHVAIIDPAGVVRYRGMHPSMDHELEAQRINELLKEFKLPAPAAKTAEPVKTEPTK